MVALATDRDEFARQVRRPVPQQPTVAARRGTTFHEWVEHHYQAPAALFDIDGLYRDDDGDSDEVLADLKEHFEASPWASMQPLAIEQPIAIPLAGHMISCKIDAVFADPDTRAPEGSVVVVDWKTGHPPRDAAARAVREIQLALYALAWSKVHGLEPEQVSAAFYYAANGTTIRPASLASEEELAGLLG
jgi:DNA helicase-2/ATP-dependent DNA helicase PcrA